MAALAMEHGNYSLGVLLCRFHFPLAAPDARLMHPRLVETLAGIGLFPDNLHVVHCYYGDDLPPVSSAAAWIVSGEPLAGDAEAPWMAGLSRFLRSAAAADIPLYGIGGGERVVAATFGGPSSRSRIPPRPSVRNPLFQFGPADRLYRLAPETGGMSACSGPGHYREVPTLRGVVASAGSVARRLVRARSLA